MKTVEKLCAVVVLAVVSVSMVKMMWPDKESPIILTEPDRSLETEWLTTNELGEFGMIVGDGYCSVFEIARFTDDLDARVKWIKGVSTNSVVWIPRTSGNLTSLVAGRSVSVALDFEPLRPKQWTNEPVKPEGAVVPAMGEPPYHAHMDSIHSTQSEELSKARLDWLQRDYERFVEMGTNTPLDDPSLHLLGQ